MTIKNMRGGRRFTPVFAGLAAGAALLAFPAVALATPAPVPAPSIPGAAPLPGPLAPASKPAATIGILKATPDTLAAGAKFTLSGTKLAPGKQVSIVWMTSKVDWILDARPDSVDYLGQQETKNVAVVLGTATTDASGNFSVQLTAPRDFGAIHDVYAVIDGLQVAKGGVLIDRTFSVSPGQGPGRDPDDDQDRRPRLHALRRRRERLVRRPLQRRRHRQVDARGGDGADPRSRPGRRTHAPDRNRNAVQLPEHQAVADPVGDRRLHTSRSRRTPGRPHPDRPAADRPADGRHADDGGCRGSGERHLDEAQHDLQRHQLEGRRHGDRPRPREARHTRLDDGGRQPRELHRHVLDVRVGCARHRHRGSRRFAEHVRSRCPTVSAGGTPCGCSRATK